MTCSGSVFQMRAPATGKARESMEVRRTAGTIRSSEVEDRSLWREETSATWILSRYDIDIFDPKIILRIWLT